MIPLPLPIPDEESDVDISVENRDPLAPEYRISHLPLKVGVTALCRALSEGLTEVDDEEETPELKRFPFAASRPKLMSSVPSMPAFLAPPKEEKALLTGVQTHRVLGLIDLSLIRPVADRPKALYAVICAEVERFEAEGILTAEEAAHVNRGMVARFFESDPGRRMLESPRVEREWSFNLRVREPFPTMVQGVIDLCFLEEGRWILIDFKTDRVEQAEELLARYSRQVEFYRRALECGTSYPVGECMLFSLRLGQSVQV